MPLRDPTKVSQNVVKSRNLFPSSFQVEQIFEDSSYIGPFVDIEELIKMKAGESKKVDFLYRSGVPTATAFGITWHATEYDADNLINMLQDEPLPSFVIDPPYPRKDTGGLQSGEVTLGAPHNMRPGTIYGVLTIYPPNLPNQV